MTRSVLGFAALTATTAALVAASAPAHPSAHVVCGPSPAFTVAHGSRARVYRSGGHLWGCARGSHRSFDLGVEGNHRSIYATTVAGVRVAYASGFMGVDTFSTELTQRRLDTGKVVAMPPVSATPLGVEGGTSVNRLVLEPGGAMAWTDSAYAIGTPHGGVELRTYSHGRARTVQRDHGLVVRSLSLKGSLLRWRDAGGWHSMTLS